MKKMTCKQLGGACEVEFYANTFDEIAEKSKVHAMEMFSRGDEDHISAMDEMKRMMNDGDAMQRWFASKKEEFENLPDA